ncbi:MAG: OmpH family outer membrane protein [SAR324 cluster bacterium]|nr:OmpH family outer membrane protein [SAR324 cluster bacterium]
MKTLKLRPLLVILFFFIFCHNLTAAPFKIAVVDLNRSLNESEAGIRSKNLLEAEGRQKQQELKIEQDELRKNAQELRDNMLLKPEAKQQKESALKQQEQSLVQKSRRFEQELRQKERQFTEKIFKELKAVIRTVAKKDKFDLVLEKNAAEIILYMNNTTTDLTEKVIDHYNSLKSSKK